MASLDRASMRLWPKGGGGHLYGSTRYQRDHRLATGTWVVLVTVIGMLWGWLHFSSSTARPGVADTAATGPASGLAASIAPTRVQLREWFAPAEASIDALFSGRDEISSAAAVHDVAGTGAACLTTDVAIAGVRQHMPSPDSTLDTALWAAIDSYHEGLRDCILYAQTRDGDGMEQAAAYLREGDADLQAAVNILDSELRDPELRHTHVVLA